MKTYSGPIKTLRPNQIFVFGSNTQGRHGKGSALSAMKFGAVYGQAKGLQGQTFAIVTKDLSFDKHPSVSLHEIRQQIEHLYMYAEYTPGKEFLIAYSGTGKNLNGYSPYQMAVVFAQHERIPKNIVFEREFYKIVKKLYDGFYD